MWRRPVVTILMLIIAMILHVAHAGATEASLRRSRSAVWSEAIVRKVYRIAFLTYVRL